MSEHKLRERHKLVHTLRHSYASQTGHSVIRRHRDRCTISCRSLRSYRRANHVPQLGQILKSPAVGGSMTASASGFAPFFDMVSSREKTALREGRLKPEVVQELIRVGKLDDRTVAQLRVARTYPEKYLQPYSGVKRVVLRTTENKTAIKTVGWLKYTF